LSWKEINDDTECEPKVCYSKPREDKVEEAVQGLDVEEKFANWTV
jgi:hypothetical protein